MTKRRIRDRAWECRRRLLGKWLRAGLIEVLGAVCERCAERRLSKLEVDHVDGRDWHLSRTSSYHRAVRYWKEYLAGVNLRVLCRSCNGSYSPTKRQSAEDDWYARRDELRAALGTQTFDEESPDEPDHESIPF